MGSLFIANNKKREVEMTTFIITRHPATVDYIQLTSPSGLGAFEVLTHVDETFFEKLSPNDMVIGTLPTPLMARVCKITKNSFFHFEIILPAEMRGKELSFEDLVSLSPKIKKYWVEEK